MTDWCDDCAWPEACAMARECARRDKGEVRGAALPEVCSRRSAAAALARQTGKTRLVTIGLTGIDPLADEEAAA